MTDINPESPDPRRPPPPTLGYRPAAADHVGRSVLQIVIGALLTLLFAVGGVFAAALLTGTGPLMVVAVVLLAAVLVGLAISLGRSPARRGFAMGVWIGLGVALLVEGVCWTAIM